MIGRTSNINKNDEDRRIGTFMSLVLRHKPEVINLVLDSHGWADVDLLIKGMVKEGYNVDFDDILRIVLNNNKKRYSFSSDESKIRAVQGHSIDVDLELIATVPPVILYHGTAERFIESILEEGIKKNKRKYVHLSVDKTTASIVGKRHGKVVILQIDTVKMLEDKCKFYISENNVWLTDFVPAKYLTII